MRSDVVIIGGGVMGCAVAYHLAVLGVKPLLFERRGLAEGATSRAAGLLSRARSSTSLVSLVRQTYADILALEAEGAGPIGARFTGSLYIGASPAAKAAHRRLMAQCDEAGEKVRALTAEEAMEGLPWLRLAGDEEAFLMPEDAYVDGYALASAYARAARRRGAQIREGEAVAEITRDRDRVTGVRTAKGLLEATAVVDAAGAWANLSARSVGAAIPMAPVRSHYWITVPEACFPTDMPFAILPDARAYARAEVGGLLFGFREAQSLHADPRDIPEDLQAHVVAGDAQGWEALEEGGLAFRRFFPAIEEVEIAHYVSGYSTYVPDGLLAIGALPGPVGLYSAAGCSGAGLAMAGGAGKALAELITGASVTFDLTPHDPGRFGAFDPFTEAWGRRCALARSGKTTG